jgi:predicted TIM-barrel fold metal-dependent hydrolase
MKTKLIDIHPHIISKDTKKYPIAPLGGEQSNWSATRPADFEKYISEMDHSGVDKAAIVHSSTTYGVDNSYVADSVALLPKRFTGVFSVDMLAADAPQKIQHWVDRGLGGLRIFTTGSTMPGQKPWLSDPLLIPGWEKAGNLGLSISVQLTQEGVPQLEDLLVKYPSTKVIIDHMLKPDLSSGPPYPKADFLFNLAKYSNVYLKLTSRNVVDSQKAPATSETFFGKAVDKFGANRIAWGSNFPASEGSLSSLVEDFKKSISFLNPDDQHWIMAGTAQILYPSLAD